MIPIRTIEKKPLQGLRKAYEEGKREGVKEGFDVAATIIRDYLPGLEVILDRWKAALGNVPRENEQKSLVNDL